MIIKNINTWQILKLTLLKIHTILLNGQRKGNRIADINVNTNPTYQIIYSYLSVSDGLIRAVRIVWDKMVANPSIIMISTPTEIILTPN